MCSATSIFSAYFYKSYNKAICISLQMSFYLSFTIYYFYTNLNCFYLHSSYGAQCDPLLIFSRLFFINVYFKWYSSQCEYFYFSAVNFCVFSLSFIICFMYLSSSEYIHPQYFCMYSPASRAICCPILKPSLKS